MSSAQGYLLDTNVVLHATRENSASAKVIEAQFKFQQSPFKPVICEVTVAELWAFARGSSWGDKRKTCLRKVLEELVILPISDARIHQRWAELYSFARSAGMAIQHDHNDVWIAATAHVAGLQLVSMDAKAFLPLRGTHWVQVAVLDAKTGCLIP